MKLDILVIAAHPDDAELSAGGTIIANVAKGRKVGIVDLTRGEMGTRGTPEIRLKEAAAAAEIMGVTLRDNLEFEDAFFTNDREHQLAIVRKIRAYQPELVIANAVSDRHPDHGKGSALISQACFISGLKRVETEVDGFQQEAWRPKNVYHMIQSNFIDPDFVVDVSDHWDKKMAAVRAYKSQFFDPDNKEPDTFISTPAFMNLIESRGVEMGQPVGFSYAEGFTIEKRMGIKDLFELH
ncbi:MAG: bacillithiol biosynthesis deacetylase BshB1 [Cyclobacteriaceae bacterium]